MLLLIRPADAADADPIATVFLAARRAGMPWLRVLRSDAATRWWVRTSVLTTGTIWVAEEAEQVVGFAGVCGDVLAHLYVHPDAWNRHVGTQLLETVRDATAGRLVLCVFRRNVRARRFYEAKGFMLRALGTGAMNEEREPDAYYEWHRPDPVVDVG